MTSRDFCYWLQGFFEIATASAVPPSQTPNLSPGQVECIKKHLSMVFIHEIDPAMGPAAHQAALTAAHGGGGPAQPPKPLEALAQAGLFTDADAPRFNC